MKRSLVFLTLVALSVGCDARPHLRSANGLSTQPATWRGYPGTAVTIQFKESTDQFSRAEAVTFDFVHPIGRPSTVAVADFMVEVMKREPRALTLFFRNGDSMVLEHLPEQIAAGTLVVIACDPHNVCGGEVYY